MKSSSRVLLALCIVLVLVVIGVAARGAGRRKADIVTVPHAPSNSSGALLVPLYTKTALPANPCAPMFKQLFEARAAFLVEIPLGGNCAEVAIVDSGWWPTTDPFSIWLEWNADKGAPSPPGAARLGTYDAKVKGVGGKTVTSKTTLWTIPSFPLRTTRGTVRVAAPSQRITLSDGSVVTATAPVAMSGQLAGKYDPNALTLGGAFPRSLITFDFLAGFGVVFSYNSNLLGLYSLGGGLAASHSEALKDFSHLGPLATRPAAGTTWGFMVELTLKVEGKALKGMFLVDTGAVGITLMVTSAFGARLGCYSPVLYDRTAGVGGVTCAPMRRACVVDASGAEVCIPVDVEGSVVGCPNCAGRIGTALLALMDVFVCRAGGQLGSAYTFVAPAATLAAYECAQIQGQCPPPCTGTATCSGPQTPVAKVCPNVAGC